MKIGIVGSRRRTDKLSVASLVDSLPEDSIVVSGGCKGVDSWAEERAKERGLKVIVFRPDLNGCKKYHEYVFAYFKRNRQIAAESDIVYAFVTPERTGGTENTIKQAIELGKKVEIR